MFSMMPYYTTHSMKSHGGNDRYLSPFGEDFLRAFFGNDAMSALKVDVEDTGDCFLLETDLPGVRRENVHISVENGVLTIAVNQNEEKDENAQERNYVYHERRTSSVSRSFSLEGVDEEKISAEYTDGVLHLTLPKKTASPEQGARQIEIH